MATPWIKICGLTRPEDARLALDLGALYLGCILVPTSPRAVSLDQARALAEIAGPRLVTVVRNLPPEELAEIVSVLHPGVLQLHGEETPERVAGLRAAHPEVELWRVLALAHDSENPGEDCVELLAEAREYLAAGAHAIMIDTWTPKGSGGTGETCDWAIASNVVELLEGPVVLAGGITPEIVRHAVRLVRPAGLDISSGVEEAPGIKSPERVRKLFHALKHWDEQRN